MCRALVLMKAWKTFTIFLSLIVLPVAVNWLGIFPEEIKKAIFSSGLIFYIFWMLSVESSLERKFKLIKSRNDLFFKAVSFSLIILLLFVWQSNKLLFFVPIINISIFCLVYFLSKRIIFLENKNFNNNGHFNLFILIFLFPIGIWFVQPRIEKLLAEE